MKAIDPRKVFSVGGAVRDELLGLPVVDRDYVVVGSTPEEMVALGYRPVGKDFPVFLHPNTLEEYALARTERKTEPGYHGFVFHTSPEVTLEEDLARRDLTINAMARGIDGKLIDPHNGRADLAARMLRHVSPAFVEDPVRILRLARFAARFPSFGIAPETRILMWEMVDSGEIDYLVPERVWHELAKGLMEAHPSRMFEALRACGALARLLPEIDALFGVKQRSDGHPEIDTGKHLMLAVDMAARMSLSLPARFAVLTHDVGQGISSAGTSVLMTICARLRVPSECRDLAMLAVQHHADIHRVASLEPAVIVKVLERCDALRRPDRFEELLRVCEADFRGRPDFGEKIYYQADLWRTAFSAMRAVDAGQIAGTCDDPALISVRLHEARVAVVAALGRQSMEKAPAAENYMIDGNELLPELIVPEPSPPGRKPVQTGKTAEPGMSSGSTRIKRKLTSILAADAVGFSRMMHTNDEETLRVLATHRHIIDKLILTYDGRIFNTAGDSILAEFSSPVDAVRCANEIQVTLRSHDGSLPADAHMMFRIGVNLGDVMVNGDDLLGDGVNVAARLESIAEPGGIYISSNTYDQVCGKVSLGFEDLGDQRLKNIDHPVHVYKVIDTLDFEAPLPSLSSDEAKD